MLKKPFILPDGYPFIASMAFLAALFFYLGKWWVYIGVIPLVLCVYFTYFFRCPKRNDKIPAGDDTLVSPSDGTVMAVEDHVREDSFLGEDCKKITIFLSIFDVHCNRTPMAGTIKYQSYKQGRFRPAYENEASFVNEQGAIGIEGKKCSILVILIAGILARRVVSWKSLGDTVQKGELYGMIKFGSCTEIYVPRNVEVCVHKGDHVTGGLTVIGRLQ
jgi:phosphatidylserine decarboxylase